MKIFRLINGGWVGNFVMINDRVYVLLSDSITALKLHSEGKGGCRLVPRLMSMLMSY